jgi:CspA family cold shock protein
MPRSVRPLPSQSTAMSSSVAALRLPAKELDALIADLIGLLETTVLPELRRGHYPDRTRSTQVTAMVRTLAHDLDVRSH